MESIMINIAVCDDESEIRKKIRKYTETYLIETNYKFSIKEFEDGESLLLSSEEYAIVFLDIDMKTVDGLTAARKLREINKITKIIFITNHSQYIKQALLVRAFGYLDKPIQRDEFELTLKEALEYYRDVSKSLNYSFHTIKGDMILDLQSILYFEYIDRKIQIYQENQVCFAYTTIKKLSIDLKEFSFSSPHQAYLVNLKFVSNIYQNEILLLNGEIIPLSQKKSVSFRLDLTNYISKNYIRSMR